MYWSSILLLLTWPALILLSWFLVKFFMKKYNDVFESTQE